jgi:hypothetical protein
MEIIRLHGQAGQCPKPEAVEVDSGDIEPRDQRPDPIAFR